jgi:hypothetical protein
MEDDCYLKPAWTHNGSIRTDIPMVVVGRKYRRKIEKTLRPGQLLCVGKVYLKTHNDLIRVR